MDVDDVDSGLTAIIDLVESSVETMLREYDVNEDRTLSKEELKKYIDDTLCEMGNTQDPMTDE